METQVTGHRRAEVERQIQIEEARRLAAQEATPQRRTISLNSTGSVKIDRHGAQIKTDAKRSGKPATGHEAFLKALCHSGAEVIIEKVSSGQVYKGKLKHSDAYTVTMLVVAIQHSAEQDFDPVTPVERVIYKHDISEFYTTTPRKEQHA